jgi:hypothetical protein
MMMEHNEVLEWIIKAKTSNSDTLDLSNKGITDIPDDIGLLTRLKVLDLSYNQINALPSSIVNLKKLEKLYLQRNNISNLPTGIGNLSKLKILDVSYNSIVKIPAGIGLLRNLEFLDASYCKLRKLPFGLTGLLSIKTLILEENRLVFPPQKVVNRGLYAIMHFLTIELRKNEASRAVIHVFNMPESFHAIFRQYVQLFTRMVSKTNDNELSIDISYINADFRKGTKNTLKPDVYMLNLIKYMNQLIDSVAGNNHSRL